jgi:hypothetical protein
VPCAEELRMLKRRGPSCSATQDKFQDFARPMWTQMDVGSQRSSPLKYLGKLSCRRDSRRNGRKKTCVDGASAPSHYWCPHGLGLVQFSIFRPETRPNSRVLFVTRIRPRLRALRRRSDNHIVSSPFFVRRIRTSEAPLDTQPCTRGDGGSRGPDPFPHCPILPDRMVAKSLSY